jgi:hypothetical protein
MFDVSDAATVGLLVKTLGRQRPRKSAHQRVELSGVGECVFSELAVAIFMDCGVGSGLREARQRSVTAHHDSLSANATFDHEIARNFILQDLF